VKFTAQTDNSPKICCFFGQVHRSVSFIHRFGSALNANLHFHCCVIDGVFSAAAEGLRFHPAFLTDTAIARVQQQTRRRVLKLFQHREWLPENAA
jgi:hypothetical protein